MNARHAPIGVFDSGVGGLSVLREIWRELPEEAVIFLADQAHVPYGSRSLEEVRRFAGQITRHLLRQGAKLIVVACNTASAAALYPLRQAFPKVPFVGMEPAVKPAAETTQSGVVGVLATPATFQGALYASVVERFANGVQLLQHTCPGLVQRIEAGDLRGPDTRRILEQALQPMLAMNIDTVVLGCTHYPFVIPVIEEIVGPDVRVIDPAPAVARQVRRLLDGQDLPCETQTVQLPPPQERTRIQTSGAPEDLEALLPDLLAISARAESLAWKYGRLVES